MAKQLTEEQLEKNYNMVLRLIDSFPEPRREKVKQMFAGKVGSEYMLAPASSRVEFHSCYAGGLCEHSLNVVKCLKQLADTLAPKRWSNPTLAFVGLFHDLGKVGDGEEPYYVPNPSDWHRSKGMLYEVNDKCVWMPTSERGLYLLQKFDVEMSSDEYLAIRLNDGMYDDTNKGYRMKEPDLALLVHWADRWSTSQEKE